MSDIHQAQGLEAHQPLMVWDQEFYEPRMPIFAGVVVPDRLFDFNTKS